MKSSKSSGKFQKMGRKSDDQLKTRAKSVYKTINQDKNNKIESPLNWDPMR